MDCERTVNCPYNVSHQVSEERLQYHLVKCKRNHPWKENIHIFQVTKKATILESELDCEWNKVGGLIPRNPVTLPPQDEDWNEEYVTSPLQTLDVSDKPVFRNLPGATKSERKIFRREERCRFEKVIETMKQSEKSADSTKRSGKRSKQTRREPAATAEEKQTKTVSGEENKKTTSEAQWKSVKSRSRKRGGAKKSPVSEDLQARTTEKTKEETTPAPNVVAEEVEKTDDHIGELRVAFHDMNVVNEPSGVGAENTDTPGNSVPDFQAVPSGDLQCSKNSVFQDWDKILIHDLPTTDCGKDDMFSPVTSFADILSKNPSSEKPCQEFPEKADLSAEAVSSSAASVHRASTNRSSSAGLRRRSTTRDKTPSDTKTYENYTNLNSILGRTSRKCMRTMFPLEPSLSTTKTMSASVDRGLDLSNSPALRAQGCGVESNPDSFFCSRRETPFSYASILSKKPCSSA